MKVYTDADLNPRPTEFLQNVLSSNPTYDRKVLWDLLGELEFDAESGEATEPVGTVEGSFGGMEVHPPMLAVFVWGDDAWNVDAQFHLDDPANPDGPGKLFLEGNDFEATGVIVPGGLTQADLLVKRVVEASDKDAETTAIANELESAY